MWSGVRLTKVRRMCEESGWTVGGEGEPWWWVQQEVKI
jgi:hypothetical protein